MKPSGRKRRRARRRVTGSLSTAPTGLDFLDGLPLATILLKPDLTVLAANREANRLLGLRFAASTIRLFPSL